MAVTKQKKDEVLADLIGRFGRSKSVVFADYRGLDVAGISELRRQLREHDAEMKVAKKTLMRIAAKDTAGSLDEAGLDGPVVATFCYQDPFSGLKVLYKFSKTNEKIKLLGGIMDGKVVDAATIKKYAMIPSHDELIAMFMGSMNSPLSGFVRVLDAYKNSKEKEETVAATPAPTPAPAAPEVVEAPATPEAPVAEAGEAPAATV